MMVQYDRQMRGIPLWLLREYLEEVGGRADGDHCVNADGWQARLTQMEDFRIGSLSVGQVRLEVQATPEAWLALQPILERKLLRAGG